MRKFPLTHLDRHEAYRCMLTWSMMSGHKFDEDKKRILAKGRALLIAKWRIYRALRKRYKQNGK